MHDVVGGAEVSFANFCDGPDVIFFLSSFLSSTVCMHGGLILNQKCPKILYTQNMSHLAHLEKWQCTKSGHRVHNIGNRKMFYISIGHQTIVQRNLLFVLLT